MESQIKWNQFLPLVIILVGLVTMVVIIPLAVRYAGKAAGEPANLVVDQRGVIGLTPTLWRNLAQGGEEPKPMLGNVINEIRTLRPEYIRLDHIYDAFGVVSKNNDQLTYDWSRLDVAVGEILATGAKPFLSLSYMPPAISSGDILAIPNDWNEWSEVVRRTVEHYSGRGEKNIANVIYEVWNEPDLFGGWKAGGGDKDYLVMYEQAVRGAARASNVNTFEIGGPGITAFYPNWLTKMMDLAGRKSLRMDFFSWHRYNTAFEQFESDANSAREIASKVPAFTKLKFYVTEWGHNSENNPGYDNAFGAVHTLAMTRAMIGKVQRAFVFEIKDGPREEKLSGRWGVLTHEKFGTPEKKPRYNALEFLNALGQFRISLSGEGSFVKGIASTDPNGNIRLLVVNYDPAKTHSEAVPIAFENLSKGNFRYTRRDFLGSSKSRPIATTSASWKTTEYLGPNSAVMISLDF